MTFKFDVTVMRWLRGIVITNLIRAFDLCI